jgi:gamma-glutamyl hercynylcysteine S-oxide synthase
MHREPGVTSAPETAHRTAAAEQRAAAGNDGADQAYWESIEEIVSGLRARASAPDSVELLATTAASHPQWPVRAAAVRLLGEHHAERPRAAEAISAATHDRVDWVAFTAIKTAGEHQIRAAVMDLIKISGWPSNFTKPMYARKPVGCGAAFTKRALLSIFGSEDPATLRRLEDEHFAQMRAAVAAKRRLRENDDVVLIPAGPFIAGSSTTDVGPFQMKQTDNPLRVIELPAYFIDRTAVSNRRYRRFLEEVGDSTEFDHVDQGERDGHVPVHWHDQRFNQPDLPVVGIDWYDAWAFSRWAGGQLASEWEWEKAARGTDGRIFPWGNEFDHERANYVERAFGQRVTNLQELEALLVTTTQDGHPATPVMPVDSLPEGASPYGLLHMSGNVWEMTRTNFFTGKDMDPFLRGREPKEFMNREEAFHVLRGGTWTSPPVCLATCYRGKDLLTDLHNEVGFRCVYPAEEA